MEMLDEEIKVAVAKEMQMEKDKLAVRYAIRDKAYGHFKLHTRSPAKLGVGNASGMEGERPDEDGNKSEVLLDPKTVRKIDKLYHGTAETSHPQSRSKQIINDILDVGRLDFLRTQKVTGKKPLHFPGAGRSLALTQTAPWASASGRRMMMSPETAKSVRKNLASTAYFTEHPPFVQHSPASSRIAGSKIFTPKPISTHISPTEMESAPPQKIKDMDKMRQGKLRYYY